MQTTGEFSIVRICGLLTAHTTAKHRFHNTFSFQLLTYYVCWFISALYAINTTLSIGLVDFRNHAYIAIILCMAWQKCINNDYLHNSYIIGSFFNIQNLRRVLLRRFCACLKILIRILQLQRRYKYRRYTA